MSIVLATGLVFELRGQKYRIERMLGPNHVEARNVVARIDILTLNSADFEILVGRGELKFLSQNPKRILVADFSQLPEADREEAIKSWHYLSDLAEYTRKEGQTLATVKKSIVDTAKKLNDTSAPNVATVYRWKKKFISSGSDIRVLAKNNAAKGSRMAKLDFDVQLIVEQQIQEKFTRSRFVTVNDLQSAIENEIEERNEIREKNGLQLLKVPSISTVRKRLKKLNSYDLIESKYGKEAAEKIFRYIGKKEQPTRPLEVCQIDHTVLDLFVLSDKNNLPIGRPTITVMLDVFSRSVCGFYLGFDNPGYLAVMYCLNHAISPKEYVAKSYPNIDNQWHCHGLPEVLVVDNGPEFINRSLEDACYQLNIKLIQAPPYEPQFKGVIERFIQTQNTSLLHSIPGATFSDQKSRLDELLKFGYNPEKDAVIYLDDLIEILHIFYIDYYHQKPHKSLQLRNPSKVWEEGVREHTLILPSSDVDLLVTLGRIETRKLTRLGIEWQGLIYNSPELTPMRIREKGKEVMFKYNPSDISAIFVFDKTRDNYIRVPALDQKNTHGVSLWEHRVILRNAKEDSKKVDSAALARARMKIQDIILRRISKAKSSARKKVSRFHNERFTPPTPGQPVNTAGLPIDALTSFSQTGPAVHQTDLLSECRNNLPEPSEFANPEENIHDDVEENLEVFEADYALT